MSAPVFDRPDEPQAPETGDRFKLSENAGRLIAIRVDEYRPEQKTLRGPKPALTGVITVCDGPEAGKVYDDQLLFGAVLVPQLREKVGRIVLGRIRLGEPRDGNNPPVIFDPASDADTELAVRAMTGGVAVPQQQAAQPAQAAAATPPPPPWAQAAAPA